MALSNNSYIVYTATGEVIVLVNESVSYLNVSLVGYDNINYHSLISQSLANLADDIKALQDGGLAQATYDLDQLIADAKAEIDAQIAGIESGINDKIIRETSEAVESTIAALAAFELTLNGAGGVVESTTANTIAIGDAASGLTKRVDTIDTTLYDPVTGLEIKFGALTDSTTQLLIQLEGDPNDVDDIGVFGNVDLLKAQMTDPVLGMIPRVTTLEAILGDSASGLTQEINLINDKIFGDGSYDGLLSLVGTSTTGLVEQANTLRTDLDAEILLSGDRTTLIENILGHTDEPTTGAVRDIINLQIGQASLLASLGPDDASGLRLRVKTIEDYDIPTIKNFLFAAGTGASTRLDTNEADIIVLQNNATSNESATDAAFLELTNRVVVNEDAIELSTNTTVPEIDARVETLETTVGNSGSGLVQSIDDLPQKVVDDYFTHDLDGVNELVYTLNTLSGMKNITDANDADDINSRFVAYFGADDGNQVLVGKIGKTYLNTWLASNSTTGSGSDIGFASTANTQSDAWWASNYSSTFTAHGTAITRMDNGVGTTDSIRYLANERVEVLTDTLYGNGIEATELLSTSIDNKIATYNTNIVTPIDTRVTDNADDIADINTETNSIRLDMKDQADETQVEMVRYDTILPFLHKMFKYVNNPGSLTDDQIDDIFDVLTSSVETVALSVLTTQVYLKLDVSSSQFLIHVEIDRDQKFVEIDPINAAGVYMNIVRPSDSFSSSAEIMSAAQSTTREHSFAIIDRLYDGIGDTIGVEIADITGVNEFIVLQYATEDMFGQFKLHEQKIEI